MAEGVYKITEQFEQALCDYTGAKYAVSIDNKSNALFLALMYENVKGMEISIPSRTYPSVPCEIIHAGGRVKWISVEGATLKGAYQLLKLSKGGAILTDDENAYKWFKRARFSGRNECSYHEDEFDMLGWNFYMMPELAARGMLMMSQFYKNGQPLKNEDLELPYPDLSKFDVYNEIQINNSNR